MSEREMVRDTAEEASGTAAAARRRGGAESGGTRARVPPPSGTVANKRHEEEMPRVAVTRREAVALGLFVLTVVGFLYFVLPKLAGVGTTLHHIENGDGWWIAIGVRLELLSFAGYVVLFRAVFVGRDRPPGPSRPSGPPGPSSLPGSSGPLGFSGVPGSPRVPGPIGWKESYQITMAGLAATRLFATAGAGGIAVTAWAVRRSGMEPRMVACRMVAFMALLYGVYVGSALLDGRPGHGLFPGGGPFALTVVPAIVGGGVIAVFVGVSLLPAEIERRWGGGCRPGGCPLVARAVTARRRPQAGAHRDRADPRARPGPARSGGVVGLRHRVLWACSMRSAAAPVPSS